MNQHVVAQDVVNGYNRIEIGCMTLLSERSNVMFINDTNFVEYHFNGYGREQLVLKGDSSVHIIYRTRALPKIVPSQDTFELFIYNKSSDSLLFSEQFVAIHKDSLKTTNNTLFKEMNFCDYIFSTRIESVLYRSKNNRLILRRNNYADNLITFEVDNGELISSDPENLIVKPGKGRICEIRVYHDGQIILSKQYVVSD
jgi:hypothetical protein